MGSKKKAWENRINTSKRRVPNREIKNTFLIYCEGVNTEPEYFKSFPVTTETEVIAIGLGRSCRALVEKIIQLLERDNYLFGQKNYDEDRQIWCVFDKDSKGDIHLGMDSTAGRGQREKNGIFDFFLQKKIKNPIFLSLEVFSFPQTLFVGTLLSYESIHKILFFKVLDDK